MKAFSDLITIFSLFLSCIKSLKNSFLGKFFIETKILQYVFGLKTRWKNGTVCGIFVFSDVVFNGV